MSNTKKPDHQTTKASAAELEESELDNVEGGAFDAYYKIGDIAGESQLKHGFDGKGNDQLKSTQLKRAVKTTLKTSK